MAQVYHTNAVTNERTRLIFQQSNKSKKELAEEHGTSVKTVGKWQSRDFVKDKSSVAHNIYRTFNIFEREIILTVRRMTWMPLDDLVDSVKDIFFKANRTNVYRVLLKANLNKKPKELRRKAQKFKEYKPGFLHVDVTYLPVINGIRKYLFVAIDRATRVVYFEVYDHKTAKNAKTFLKHCIEFYPFKITHVLTDNGFEFTNNQIRSKKGEACTKKAIFTLLCELNNIEHRTTKPCHPYTNGMVERVNGTIKNNTIKIRIYKTQKEMKENLIDFLIHYILHRSHSGLRKELKIKTPLEAVYEWYEIEPELFKETPNMFKAKVLALEEQRCET